MYLYFLSLPVLAAAPDTPLPIYSFRGYYKNSFKVLYFYNMRSLLCFHILLCMLPIISIVFSYIVLTCVNSNLPLRLFIYLKPSIFLKITCPRCSSRQAFIYTSLFSVIPLPALYLPFLPELYFPSLLSP